MKNLLSRGVLIAFFSLSGSVYGISGTLISSKDVAIKAEVKGSVDFVGIRAPASLIESNGTTPKTGEVMFGVNSLGPTQYKVKLVGDGTKLKYDNGWKLKHETLPNTLMIKITCDKLGTGTDDNLIGDTAYVPVAGATANQDYKIKIQVDTTSTPIATVPSGLYTGVLKIVVVAT